MALVAMALRSVRQIRVDLKDTRETTLRWILGVSRIGQGSGGMITLTTAVYSSLKGLSRIHVVFTDRGLDFGGSRLDFFLCWFFVPRHVLFGFLSTQIECVS